MPQKRQIYGLRKAGDFMYIPKPLDTSDVSLPDDIREISEMIAKNTHEQWAVQKIKDGWKWGENLDEEAKTHPCLIEYERLLEEDKEYDRVTALEAIKVLLKLGYKITKE